jgi:membrane protease subunit HflC
MSGKALIGLVVLVLAVVIGLGSIFSVDEREKAIVFQFGEIIRSDVPPGLHFKVPFINNVRKYDARIQTMDSDPQSFLTVEKKNLVVDSFVKWRIEDVHNFYTTLGGLVANARSRLAQRVNDGLRREFGKRTVQEVISGDRALIMDVVRKNVNEGATGLGIEVVDVRLKRVDLDQEISERVYQRMEAERARVAAELRAQGAEIAEQIQADADRQRQIIVANARREAEKLRGAGDARATAIYADAFNRDREFYRFYRSLTAYGAAFAEPGSILVLDPSSEFFRYFGVSRPDLDGGQRGDASAAVPGPVGSGGRADAGAGSHQNGQTAADADGAAPVTSGGTGGANAAVDGSRAATGAEVSATE